MRPRKCRGITLLELLAVLAVSALLLTVVPPMLGNVIDSAQIKSSCRHLGAALKAARTRAIKDQSDVVLTIDVDTRSYSLRNEKRQLQLPADASIVLTTASSEQISETTGAFRFFPDGSASGGRIKLSHAALEFYIDINWLTGKVSISS